MRVRQRSEAISAEQASFNSRTREGATVGDTKGVTYYIVSIHAPVRVRPVSQAQTNKLNVSIHAPVRVRRMPRNRSKAFIVFQFTHP